MGHVRLQDVTLVLHIGRHSPANVADGDREGSFPSCTLRTRVKTQLERLYYTVGRSLGIIIKTCYYISIKGGGDDVLELELACFFFCLAFI